MEATAYGAAALRRRHDVALSAVIRQAAAATLTVLLLFAAAFLFARRYAGGLSEPLSAAALIGVGMAAAATAEAIRLMNRKANQSAGGRSASAARAWLPRAALPILGLALSLPGSSVFGLVVMWLTIVGQEAWTWRKRLAWRRTDPSHRSNVAPPNTLVDKHRRADDESSSPADWLDQAVAQRIVYRHTADGNAVVDGWARAMFAAGQQTAIVHVAFCPPLMGAPQVEAEPLDGPACDIRPTLVLPWGVRWEVKLAEPAAESASVVLGFFAAESPSKAGG